MRVAWYDDDIIELDCGGACLNRFGVHPPCAKHILEAEHAHRLHAEKWRDRFRRLAQIGRLASGAATRWRAFTKKQRQMVTFMLAEEREKADRHLRNGPAPDERYRRTMNAIFNAALDLLNDVAKSGKEQT